MSATAELLRREARRVRSAAEAAARLLEEQAENLEREPVPAPPVAPPAETDQARAEKVAKNLRRLGYLPRPGRR